MAAIHGFLMKRIKDLLKLSKCGVGDKWKKLIGQKEYITNEDVLTHVGETQTYLN